MILRVLTALAGVGFLVILVLAYFHGERGEQRVRGTEMVILASLFAVAGGVAWIVGRADASRSGAGESSIRSVAVLPLENLSRDPSQEYFADGTRIHLWYTLPGRISVPTQQHGRSGSSSQPRGSTVD